MTQYFKGGSRTAPTLCFILGITACAQDDGVTQNLGELATQATCNTIEDEPLAYPTGSDRSQCAYAVTAMATGASHTCAAYSNQRVYCWGENYGTSERVGSTAFVNFKFVDLQAGDHFTCAQGTTAGTPKIICWGQNSNGQLGQGTTPVTAVDLVEVLFTNTFGANSDDVIIGMTLGGSHACVWTDLGKAACWGNNSNRQANPVSASASINTPTALLGLTGVTAMAAGSTHTCAIANDVVRCWGNNTDCQSNPGASCAGNIANVSTGPALNATATQLGAGSAHTCAAFSNGTLRCWGKNDHLQLGALDTNHLGPSILLSLGGVRQFALGQDYTCAMSGRDAFCFGNTLFAGRSALALRPFNTPPIMIPEVHGITRIASSGDHLCAIVDHAPMCWGNNTAGKLGLHGELIDLGFSIDPREVGGLIVE